MKAGSAPFDPSGHLPRCTGEEELAAPPFTGKPGLGMRPVTDHRSSPYGGSPTKRGRGLEGAALWSALRPLRQGARP